MLRGYGCVSVAEFTPTPGLRVDLMALGPKGEFWVIECKSGRADFNADRKWHRYLDWGDRFFWAVAPDFPIGLLPPDSGIILADAHGGEIIRHGPEVHLPAARRRVLTRTFAQHAARRLQLLLDPPLGNLL
jgi:hypothetical protein